LYTSSTPTQLSRRAPLSHGGDHEFESQRVHCLFIEIFRGNSMAVVVAVVWVVGLAWMSILVLTLYMFGTQLASMVAGV
jgi:hypothetical protein